MAFAVPQRPSVNLPTNSVRVFLSLSVSELSWDKRIDHLAAGLGPGYPFDQVQLVVDIIEHIVDRRRSLRCLLLNARAFFLEPSSAQFQPLGERSCRIWIWPSWWMSSRQALSERKRKASSDASDSGV